jgi:hypothetical protein
MDEIVSKRAEISKLLIQKSANIKNGTISTISTADLKLMFELYDQIFFGSWFKHNFKGKIKFSLSRRMTKSAGLTLCPKNIDKIKPEDLIIEIKIGVDFFFQYGSIKGCNTVCGIKTKSSLEALQLVFEHELCHVIEFIHFKESNCSGDRFRAIANSLFGHTESYHKLPTYKQIAKQKFSLNIGDTVSFTFNGKRLQGILYNINKRATVMVRDKDGPFADNQGNRYSKYYVPLTLLE